MHSVYIASNVRPEIRINKLQQILQNVSYLKRRYVMMIADKTAMADKKNTPMMKPTCL